MIRCTAGTCPHTFFLVPERVHPTLCFDHAEQKGHTMNVVSLRGIWAMSDAGHGIDAIAEYTGLLPSEVWEALESMPVHPSDEYEVYGENEF